MGMGIMRVEIREPGDIHCLMYILAPITGIRVGFTTRRCMASTGRLV